MGKNIKSYATFPQSISPGKGREALQQKVQIFRLKYGTVLPYTFVSKFTSKIFPYTFVSKFTSKIFQLHFVLWQNFQRIKQNSLNSPTYSMNDAKFASIIDPFTLCFRHLPQQRTPRNSSKLCKFCAVHPHSPRITRNLHHLLTHYIVCFRCLTSGRELPKIPANQAKFAQFTHRSRKLRKFCTFRTKIHPHLVN